MYIGLKNIQQLFSDYQNVLKESIHTYCLTNWIKLGNAPVPYTMHLLYVCESSKDLRNINFTPNMHILCLAEVHNNLEKLSEEFPSSINILFIKNENPEAIYSELLKYFNTQNGIGLLADTLLDILSSESDIQSMIDHAFYAFGNPIFVFDAGFNLIAANWDEAQKSKSGMELIENKGFSNKEFQMANRHNNIHARIQKSEIPILAYNDELGYDQLLCAIDTQKDLGHIVVSAVNQPLNPIDNQLLLILKKCIDQQLKKDEFIRNTKGFSYEYFLKDLLDEKVAIGNTSLDRLDYVYSEFSENMNCLVIEIARSSNILNTHYIRNLLEDSYPNSKTLMYNGAIIAIINTPKDQLLPKEYFNDAIKICKKNNLYAGLSNCFQNIIEILEYYKQALRAIEMGTCTVDKPNLFIYEDYYLQHIKNIFMQKESSKTFCHPKINFLLSYDKKYNSELAYTLYMYLIHERNITATSTAMHMHRNSLTYRIKKINSMIGDNFENYLDRQYLILSYEMNGSMSIK